MKLSGIVLQNAIDSNNRFYDNNLVNDTFYFYETHRSILIFQKETLSLVIQLPIT
jgi:hypothetical protein